MTTKHHNQYVEALKEGMIKEAENMIWEFPIMNVGGTAFDSTAGVTSAGATPISGPMDDDRSNSLLGTPRKSIKLDGSVTEASLNPSKKLLTNSLLGGSLNGGAPPLLSTSGSGGTSNLKLELIAKRAVPLKLSAMWSTSIAGFLWFDELIQRYRFERLRKKLEQHLLPLVLQRRLKSVLVTDIPAEGGAASEAEPTTDQPTAALLAQCCPWLAALKDKDFLDEVAANMQRLRKLTGDDVVKVDDPSQGVLYLLQTGRYEWVLPASAANARPATAEKFHAPAVIGDTFGGPTRYERSLFARSKCSIWYISKSSVDAILSNWVHQHTVELYAEQSRAEMLRTLPVNYPLQPSRIALLRRMPDNLVSTYFNSFEPVVLIKGSTLFEEGSNAGTVFVVCDGIVNRSRKQRGEDPGFSQYITIRAPDGATPKNAFSSSVHRFALFGEEPHILPEKHRFSCTVYSDVLKGYRVPARVFTSMLLDDPTLLLQLRQDMLQQRAKMMRIKPEALKQVPILADVPIQRLHSLVLAMVPKVYERSQFMCQSQQALRDIYLVIRGDVRDPRAPGVVPPVLPPAKVSASAAAAGVNAAPQQTPPSGGGGGVHHNASFHMNAAGKDALNETTGSLGGGGAGLANLSFMGSMRFAGGGTRGGGGGGLSRTGSLYTPNHPTTVGSGLPNEIALQDDQDLSPPIPMAMETKIAHALGGSWEGLLQEKWHRSWEAVNVVEVWVLPTAAIRNEYNELSRNLQATILNTARVNQMKDLELESVPSTKLPPMSFYRSGSQATGNGNASDGESSRRMSQSRKGRGKAQFKLGATANGNAAESVDSSFVFDNESMTESIQLDQNPRGRHKSKARSQQQAKLLTSDSADLPNGADHTTADGVVPAASTITHKPQPPTKSQSPSKSVKKSKSSEEKQKVKKNPGLVHSGSIAMFEEDDQLAIMRKLAQERNDRQQALRSLPLEEVIRRETKRMAKGDHRHQLTLPPLLTREDVMYFHRGGEGEEPQVALGKPSPRMQAPPLAIPPDADDEETMMRRQLLFGGHEKLDEAGLMQQDRVIRVPKPPASATTTALQLPLTAGRGHKKTPMWDDAASPLPSGLMLMLKHNGTGTSARQLNPNQRSSSPQKIGVARGMPPTSASASQVSSPRATASAAIGKVRRWFQHIPETAPTMKCSSLDRKFQGTEPFDVMLVQMLRMAEDAGVLKQQQANGTFKMTSSPRTNGTYS